jgi:hypothetical protein
VENSGYFGVRNLLTDARNEHARQSAALEKQTILEITCACRTLRERLLKSRIKERESFLESVEKAQEVLDTGGSDLGPAFYETAHGHLLGACQKLVAENQLELVKGITLLKGVSESNDGKGQKPYVGKVLCGEPLDQLREHKRIMNWDRIDAPWVVLEYLCLAEQCWHLSKSYFEEKGAKMGSVNEVQETSRLFNLRGYWYEMQGIRQQEQRNRAPITFTHERYSAYLEHITAAIICARSMNGESDVKQEYFYALELKLDGNELLLEVEEQEGGARAIYLMHRCNEDQAPLKYIKDLFSSVGKPVKVPENIACSQSASKLLSALKITGELKKLFFGKGQTNSATLKAKRVILKKAPSIDLKELHQQIHSFKLLEGAFSLRH